MLRRRRWTVQRHTRAQLNGVSVADGRAYAVGNRGVLIERVGGGWVRVLSDGLAGDGRCWIGCGCATR